MSAKRKACSSSKLLEKSKKQKQATLDLFAVKQNPAFKCDSKDTKPAVDLTEHLECAPSDCKAEDISSQVSDQGQLHMVKGLKWKKIIAENLDLDYCLLFLRKEADEIVRRCEQELEYNTGMLAKVHVYGKWHDIPRKQVAFGDSGLSYTFSNNTVPARPWIPLLEEIREKIETITGHHFNFVLINRYQDGRDYMGEHKDDEKDLDRNSPIASLSLGQKRDFVFRHGKSRGKGATMHIPPIKFELEHGSLLMMNYPTNQHWYHSLPQRKRLPGLRINMTFRKMKT